MPNSCVLAVSRIGGDDSQELIQVQRWMTETELNRFEQLHGLARDQFVGGHWLVRKMLAARFGGDPCEDWPIRFEIYQKPHPDVNSRRPNACFSISHSKQWVACCVSTESVGIDIEVHKPGRKFDYLIEGALTLDERVFLANKNPINKENLFYQYWTLKEAWFKQQAGLNIPCAKWSLEFSKSKPNNSVSEQVWQIAGLTLSCVNKSTDKRVWWKDDANLMHHPV